VNSPEDRPVGPKHVEIRRYMNKIEIVTSVGFSFHMVKGCTVQKAYKKLLTTYYTLLYGKLNVLVTCKAGTKEE
jgi:hypothetical protein